MHSYETPNSTDKKTLYTSLLAQVEAIVSHEEDPIANMANVVAILKTTFNWFWIGFYRVDVRNNNLVLGPFQGPLACTRIGYDKGVCGASWSNNKTILVPDVSKFPGHIACSSLSQSEIVIPIIKNGEVVGVLDIDSENLNAFDAEDQVYLETLMNVITKHI